MEIPANLKYQETHEWVKVEGDIAVVGLTDFAQEQLGDIVFVDLPAKGKKVTQGSEGGSIESSKAVGELKIPVDGEVIEINSAVTDAPETINKSPYKDGWLLKIKMSNPAQVNSLLSADKYAAIAKK